MEIKKFTIVSYIDLALDEKASALTQGTVGKYSEDRQGRPVLYSW